MGTPNWFESMIDEEIENIFVPQDYSLMPIIRRTKFIPHRNNLAWLESWVGTMKNSGFSESKIITVAKHHPRITEPQIQTVLERINSSNLLQQQYGLDKVSIKELQQYVLSKSKKPEIVMKELIAAGWDRKTIQPFIDAYTNLGKGKRIHKVYAISYAVALKRLKISYELSEMELNALKEFIETEQVNSKSVEQITSILVNQGWSKKDIHPFVKSYVRVSPHRNS